MKHTGLVLLLLSVLSTARADFYQGIRQMGMGGAAVAVVNDETSLLINPIGLGRLRVPYVTLIDPELTTNMDSVGTVQDLLGDVTDVQEIYTELAGRLDERYFFRGQIFPSYVDRNFGLGFLAKTEVMAVRSSTTQFLDLNYTSDWAAAGGYNYSFFGGQIKVGAAGRLIDRVQYTGTVDPVAQGLEIKNLATEGLGLAADVGLSLSSPTALLPTISLVAKDIGDTSFTLGDGYRDYSTLTAPSKVPMTLDVAAALFPIWSNLTRGTFTVEYDDVLEDGEFDKKFHAGVEVNLADRFFFRGGWNRGYLTGGFEWAGPYFQFQFAYYGEEVGTDANPLKDERVAIKTVFRF